MQKLRNWAYHKLRWSERFTKTDMVYLAKGGFWMNANIVCTNTFALVLSIVFAWFVEKETFGTYQFLISISSILSALTLTGMNAAVTQAVARGYEGVFEKSVKTQIKLGIIPFTAGTIGSVYYLINNNFTLSISILIIAILLPLINSFNTWTSYLSGKKEFKDYFFYGQLLNFIYYTGLIVSIFVLPKATFLIFINFFLLTAANFLIYLMIIKKYKPSDETEDKAMSYGKKLSVSSVLPMITMNMDNIIIFHFLGATGLAIYAFASNIPERLGSLLRPITIMALPKFSEKDPVELAKIIPQKTLQLLTFSTISGLIYIFASPYIFKIFFPSYMESVFYSQIYALVVILNIAGSISLTSLFARRSEKIHILNITYPVFNLVALGIGGYFFGILGVILGKLTGNLFLLAGSLYFNKA